MGYTYNWTIYGKRNVKDLNSYMPTYKQQNIAKPTSTYTPTEYSDSRGTYAKDISAAKAALNNTISNKPGEYQSQYADRMDSIVDKMGNRKFSYDVNSDALFQQLKALYDEQGKQSMANTQGQAAALTGGYGNSYGVAASQQAYQQSQENLYDRIPELQKMALTQYQQEGTDLQNLYAMLSDRDTTDYGRYRDTVSDWQTDRSYYDTALRNLQSMNQTVWGQNETNKYNANKLAWDNYQWGENYDLDAYNKALAMARDLRNDDVSYNQWADQMTETSKQNSWQRASTDYWNGQDQQYKYDALAETSRHNQASEANDAYSNQTTREHYERSDAENTRSNKASEAETTRHNQATETATTTYSDGSKSLSADNSTTKSFGKKLTGYKGGQYMIGRYAVSDYNSYVNAMIGNEYDKGTLTMAEVKWLQNKYLK